MTFLQACVSVVHRNTNKNMNKYNANDDDDESFLQVASCPGWLVGGISYLGPVLILFRLHSTPSNMSFIKDYSGGDEEGWIYG